MNETVNLPQLITRLSKVTGADSNTCRRFLREFFETITETLAQGETVTIDGLGTFCRSAEPTADGNPRLLFAPDQGLAEEVNRPFSMFQAVELADGINESDLAPKAEPEQEEISEPEPTIEPEPEVTIISNPEPKEQPESEIILVSEPEPLPEPQPEPLFSEPEAEPEPQPEPQPELKPEVSEETHEPEIVPSFPEDEEDVDEDAPLPMPEEKSHHSWLWIAIIAVAFGIIGGIAAAFLIDVEPEIDGVNNAIVEEVENSDSIIASAEAEEVTTEQQTASAPTSEPTQTATPAPQATATAAPSAAPQPVYETVSTTNYLSVMARRHYGKQSYWIFIYEANSDKLRNPNTIAAGTRVLIPTKSSLPGATEAETQRIAEQRIAEVNRRYGIR